MVAAERQRVLAQVDTLRRAEISQVPYLIENLEPFRGEITPQLRELLQQPKLPEKDRFRIRLAMVANDENQVPYLRDRLLTAEPAELLVLRAALLPYREGARDGLWKITEDPKADNDRRLRAACALAALDAESPRWQGMGNVLTEVLVAENPLVAVVWVEALRPVRNTLLPALTAVFRDHHRSDSERSLAAGILADYAAGRPELLADLLADADGKDYATFFSTIKTHGGRAITSLTERLREKPTDDKPETQDRCASRRANLAIALLAMGEGKKVWPLLRHTPDPSARSYIIHRTAPLGLGPRIILRGLDEEGDVSARRALILCLGEFGTDRLSLVNRKRLIPRLLALYRDDPDGGIHAAAEWLLRQWKQGDEIRRVDRTLATGNVKASRHWYVNGQSQTMVILKGPVEFMMGSPNGEKEREPNENLHMQRIDHSFAIATKEVTVEQFKRFRSNFAHNHMHCSPEPDCPILGVTWYEAAAYCNWLSEQEHVPRDQWCYEPNGAGEFAEGMKLVAGWAQRTGYRLPTEAEWEYACRANSLTSRYYGRAEELLGKYAWYMATTKADRTFPGGMLKPNDFGLFDMLGNEAEWCQEVYRDYYSKVTGAAGNEKLQAELVNYKDDRVLRGGGFAEPAWTLRSAERFKLPPGYRDFTLGVRAARTYN